MHFNLPSYCPILARVLLANLTLEPDLSQGLSLLWTDLSTLPDLELLCPDPVICMRVMRIYSLLKSWDIVKPNNEDIT